MSEWTYNDRPVEAEDYEGMVAFVYLITNTATGRQYIGKKRLATVRRTKVKGKTKRKVVRKQSDWIDYWGSNKPLLEELAASDKANYTRKILRWCRTLSEASYYETREILCRDALLKPDQYYNEWCTVKVTRKHLAQLHR
jgi:hypothetical protein